MKRFHLLLLLLITELSVSANNIQVTNVTHYTTGGIQFVQFDISWENSWRVNSAPFNYDAAWIFVKRRDCAAQQWHHANLSPSDPDHSGTALLTVDAYSDKKGVMLYRTSVGVGNIPPTEVILKLDAPPAGDYEYKVFAIEMVYVPGNPFYVGDSVSQYCFHDGSSGAPYLISSEDAITVSLSNGGFYNSTIPGPHYVIPAAYPKGFNAFYCMKYELSQGQYADFMNTINQDASGQRYNPALQSLNRYTITGVYSAFTASAPDRACNFISPHDLAAYLDWSALSPMTELEFEKACRGPSSNAPLLEEYAWGGTGVVKAVTITPGTDGQPNETVDDVIPANAGLANYNNSVFLDGPLRCGFAAKNATNRRTAGATYYGSMEMSGNVYEICYSADSAFEAVGYLFDGTHGDGELSNAPFPGYSNQGWPGLALSDPAEETYTFCARGGSWATIPSLNAAHLTISNRTTYIFGNSLIHSYSVGNRGSSTGGRGVSRRQ